MAFHKQVFIFEAEKVNKRPEENFVFGRVSYYFLFEFVWKGVGAYSRLGVY